MNTPLTIALDIGHSSIGWSVISDERPLPSILGCGTVTFEKDSALANSRRMHRSQRRHVRATRQRIARMEALLIHQGIFTAEQLAAKHTANGGSATPWLLAARVLASDGKQTLTWPELWDVLRWYAHNRGYEEIGRTPTEADTTNDDGAEDAEKVANAKAIMAKFATGTMAETICQALGQDPLKPRSGTTQSYKANNCAFERQVVVSEVAKLLSAHRGKLKGVDEPLIACLLLDARAIPVPTIRLPKRYQGSLLFGRLATRYHNRIIGRCPISGEKVPSKNCPEFLLYRWGMQLANLRITTSASEPLRELSASERSGIHAAMLEDGALTPTELKRLVAGIPNHVRNNLEQFFLHPDAKEGLLLDPVQKLIKHDVRLLAVWPHLPEQVRIRTRGRWRRGKSTTLARLRSESVELGHDCTAFDAAIEVLCNPPKKPARKTPPPTKDELLAAQIDARRDLARLSGRAPYARPLLRRAFEDVMAGLDPKGSGGCLEETPKVRAQRDARPLDEQTNNHLIRHRLHLLEKLLKDIAENPHFGGGQPEKRIAKVVIEVNRDLREMSGLSAEEIAKELGQRLKHHGDAVRWLEKDPQVALRVSAGLIRKARVALDLGCRCPYTGEEITPIDLLTKRVDLDHIIPRSQRQSDSLDSLALTFASVNQWKGARTAWKFIQDEGGKPVPGEPRLSLATPERFKKHVESLDARGHLEDMRRKKRRKEFFLMEDYSEKARTFTPGQLTQTSQLARLGAVAVRSALPHLAPHDLIALPGSVTGTVRKGWDLLGCLASANPAVVETIQLPEGKTLQQVRPKGEIRDITHLHHALDAVVLALAAHLIPNNGQVWRFLTERRLTPAQRAELATLGLFDFDERGHFRLRDLPNSLKEQLRQRLAECRVVQHVPADMSGIRVEENTRGIVSRENGLVRLRKRKRTEDGHYVTEPSEEREAKLIGLPNEQNNLAGKLGAIGGVRVITENYGVAIYPPRHPNTKYQSYVIPFAGVWRRLNDLKNIHPNSRPLIWRNGQVIRIPTGPKKGVWKIFSIVDSSRGIIIKLDRPDAITFSDNKGSTGVKLGLQALLSNGAQRMSRNLTGFLG